MRDFPSCFGENGVQVADSSSQSSAKNPQNLVTCVYQCRLRGRSCSITVTWTKNLMGQQRLSIGIDDSTQRCLCKVDVRPWVFSRRKGSKTLQVDSARVDLFWDLTAAKFGRGGPEPSGGFYLAVAFDSETVLLLGDPKRDPRGCGACVPRREARVVFEARFRDGGRAHEVAIECDAAGPGDPSLAIRVDGERAMVVKRLRWKFRGNGVILVDGVSVHVFWDVHDWLFGNAAGNAVFMFRSSISAARSLSDDDRSASIGDWCRTPQSVGFSLVLYAWKNE